MSANIDAFKANLKGGGARANQFQITFNPPTGIATGLDSRTASFLTRTGQLPGSSVSEVVVPFRGRNLYLAGDREYETWTTTVLNDTDFMVRNAMEAWNNGMNNFADGSGLQNVADYTSTLIVRQLDRNDAIIKTYNLINCFPQAIGAIDLSFDTTTEIETFDITWRYTHFQSVGI
jgi:hypothetical protein